MSHNIQFHFFSKINHNIASCDLLIIENKYLSGIDNNTYERTLNQINNLKNEIKKIYLFDTQGSSSNIDKRILDIVDRYYKNQLYVDRNFPRFDGHTERGLQ